MRFSKMAGLAALVAASLLLGACGSEEADNGSTTGGEEDGATTSTSTIDVVTKDFKFDPTSLDVEPGAEVTVTLTNEDDAEHTFTVEELDVEVEAHGGETAETTFTAPDSGSYEFICEYHPEDMRGTLSVGGDTGAGGSPEDSGDKSGDKSGDDGGSGNPKY